MLKFLLSTMLFTNILFAQTSDNFFDTLLDLEVSLDDAREAKKKGIMIFFGMENCPFCHKMKVNVLNTNEAIEFYKKNFLLYELDINGQTELVNFKGEDTTSKEFAHKHRVRATPVIAFFDLEGKKIFKRTGYSNLAEFMVMGKYIVDDIYLKENFIRYKRKALKK